MNLLDLYARIVLDTSDYEKGVKESTDGFEKLRGGISNVTKVAAGISTAVATVSTVLAKAGLEAAAEVRAETSAFQQTFGDMADAATEAIGRVAESSGILQTRLNALGSKIYAFARSSGGDVEESMALMERALQAAADSAAYYDTSVEQATETLQSFLKGNFANDAALGLSATETTRNAAAMELFGQKYAELTEIQKQETLLKMVEDAQRLSGAMGQAAREADGWENVIGNLRESWRQLKAKMGEPVLDTVTPIIKDMSNAVNFLVTNWDDVTNVIGYASEAAALFFGLLAFNKVISGFQQAQLSVSLLTMQIGKANLAQAALNGTMTIGETIVSLITGKIKLAELAQIGWNAAVSANPIGLLAAAVAGLGVAMKKAIDYENNMASELAGVSTTAEEAEEKLASLMAELDATVNDVDEWGVYDGAKARQLEKAIADVQSQLEELREQEMQAAETAAEPVDKFRAATEQYAQEAKSLYEKFVETYEGMFDKVSGWFGPFDEAATTVKTNINDMMAAMQSQIDFNQSYTANLQALKEYGLGGLSEAFESYGKDGAAYAQAIVEAVEQAGGATTESGQQIIQGFADINQKVTESQGELAQTMALLDGEMEADLKSMNESYAAAIEGLDKSKEAKSAAEMTFDSFLKAMNAKIPDIVSTANSIGSQIRSALQSGIGSITIPMSVQVSGNIAGHATGLDFVPYDNYLAYLHKGEAVLTASEATAWRAGKDAASGWDGGASGSPVINQYIQSVAQTPVELASATAAYFEQARWT